MHPFTRLAAVAASTATLAAAVALVTAVPSTAETPYAANGAIKRAAAGGLSVTDNEFVQTCPTLPTTQGEDAYVFALPANVATNGAHVSVAGNPATHTVHAYAYKADCTFSRDVTGGAGRVTLDLANGERYLSVYTTTASLVTLNVALTMTPPGTTTPSPTATPTTASPTPTAQPGRGTYPLTPNDPLFAQEGADNLVLAGQWGMRRIHAPQAWQQARSTGAGVTVAVLDSGLDLDHEDFACPGKVKVVANSDPDPDGKDLPIDNEEGHGTHVAGIIGACTNNGKGVVGVAPDSTIMPIQVLSSTTTDAVGSLVDGIDNAVANGAHVINMSLGYSLADLPGSGSAAGLLGAFEEIDRAIDRAIDAGVVVVAAAGNESLPLCGYPAIAIDVICVGSSDKRDLNSWYGNFPVKDDATSSEPDPALLAPGGVGQVDCGFSAEDVISTYARSVDESENDCDGIPGYATLSGTSMASPHVAGVAALVYDRIGGVRSAANRAKVEEALLESAVDLYGPGYDPASGYGRVDALAAVTYFDAAPEPTPTATPTPTARPTSLAFTAPASGQFSDSAALEATLTGDGGPIANEPLTFQLLGRDGFRQVQATTDANGVARATLPLDAPPGAYDLSAGYAGKTGTWQTSTATRTFGIDREDTRTTLVVSGSGAKKTLTATVADADSNAGIAGIPVTFFANGTRLGEAVTGADGTATFTPPSGARGSGTAYTATFAGNAFYLPS